jgi:LysR family transcriptional regulator, glycine cleavage system transcriptional activator
MAKSQQPRLSMDLLRVFETAARHMSFTGAAQELFVTQSAISHQIKSLEEQLGMPLFQRLNRGLRLTDAGQTLYGAASEASEIIDDAIESLMQARTRASVAVTVTVPFASVWLAPRLRQFTLRHPDYDVRIIATNEAVDLARHGVDLAIQLYRPDQAPARAERLAADEVLPVCAPELLRNAARPLATPADLAHHVLLRLETLIGGRPRIDWIRWLKATGLAALKPAGTLSFSHYDQVVQAAVDGNGIALGRLPLVARHLRDGLLVAPFANQRVRGFVWYVSVAPKSEDRAPVRAFVGWLHDEIRRDALEEGRAAARRRARPPAPRRLGRVSGTKS